MDKTLSYTISFVIRKSILVMSAPLLIFVNPNSGGGLAPLFVEQAQRRENVHFVRLPDDAAVFAETFCDLLRNPDLRIVAAGGDGTVNWTISLLSQVFPHDFSGRKPPLAVCPFGTGNDLSRALGWGGGMTEYDIQNTHEFLQRVAEVEAYQDVDIWDVEVCRTDVNEKHSSQMINYFSIGVDAAMANDFEWCRKNCSCLFCCQCISKALYLPVGTWNFFGNTTLDEYLTAELEDSSQEGAVLIRNLPVEPYDRTFVVQAIPSIYGGRDLWQVDIPRSMNDKKLEITLQGGSFLLGLTHIGIYVGRPIGQATRIRAFTSQPCYYQIDGEGRVANGPTSFTINRVGSYPLLFSQ